MATVYDCSTKPNHEVYEEIKKYFQEIYKCIDDALKYDENGENEKAIEKYEFSLVLMDQVLNMPLESPTQPDVEWEKTFAMIKKLRKSRKEVLERMNQAQLSQHSDAAVLPPSYDEAMAASTSVPDTHSSSSASFNPSQSPSEPYLPGPSYIQTSAQASNCEALTDTTFEQLNAQLHDLKVEGNREIIYSHNNVRLYFIAPDGRVSACSEPDTLTIGRLEDLAHDDILDDTLLSIVEELRNRGDSATEGHSKSSRRGHRRRRHRHHGHRHHSDQQSSHLQGSGQIYIQVGSWIYPLIPGLSPVFRADFGAFILPDVHSNIEGASVGIILPHNADKSVYEILDSILLGVMSEKEIHQKPVVPRRVRRKADGPDYKPETTVAGNIIRGANYVANNLVRGAGSASRFLDATTPRIMTRINPPSEVQPVNPTVKTGVNMAKTVSSKASNVSDFLSTKVGSAASALGEYLAPYVRSGGTKLLKAATKMSDTEAESKMESVMDATSGAVEGIATVYSGLENSAGILARSLSNNTVQIIEYKYGQSMGQVAGDALSTASNVYNIHGNYKFLKPTKVAKVVVKSALRPSHEEFEGSGPGDGSGWGHRNSLQGSGNATTSQSPVHASSFTMLDSPSNSLSTSSQLPGVHSSSRSYTKDAQK